jgi:hypothetical protein
MLLRPVPNLLLNLTTSPGGKQSATCAVLTAFYRTLYPVASLTVAGLRQYGFSTEAGPSGTHCFGPMSCVGDNAFLDRDVPTSTVLCGTLRRVTNSCDGTETVGGLDQDLCSEPLPASPLVKRQHSFCVVDFRIRETTG